MVLIIFTSCVNYEELIERRQGTEYVVTGYSYGGYAIMRTHDFENYFLITFKDRMHLIKGDRILINPSYKNCLDPCKVYLNDDFISEMPMQVLLKAKDKAEAYKAFDRYQNK